MEYIQKNWKLIAGAFGCMLFGIIVASCSRSDNHPQQYQQQPQYVQQAPAPVIVQQAPAQPVVVQQSDNSGSAMVAGAVIGAVAAGALNSNRGPDYDRGYNTGPQTVVNKTVVVNNHVQPPQPEKQVAPVEPPKPTTAAAVAPVPAPAKVPNYGVPNAVTPTMAAVPAPVAKPVSKEIPPLVAAPKPVSTTIPPLVAAPTPAKPAVSAPLQMSKAAPPPPPPAPKKVDYSYKAPATTSYSAPKVTYTQKTPSTATTTKK